MFTLVNYVRLSQGYIRGRFVLKQQQFLIGRAASVWIKVVSLIVICEFNERELSVVICEFRINNMTPLY